MGKKLFLVVNVLFITLIGILFYQAFNIYIMKESLKKDIVNLEKEVEDFNEKKKVLQDKIDNFSEEEKIERVARDTLDMKKEGETIYMVGDGKDK